MRIVIAALAAIVPVTPAPPDFRLMNVTVSGVRVCDLANIRPDAAGIRHFTYYSASSAGARPDPSGIRYVGAAFGLDCGKMQMRGEGLTAFRADFSVAKTEPAVSQWREITTMRPKAPPLDAVDMLCSASPAATSTAEKLGAQSWRGAVMVALRRHGLSAPSQ